MARLGEMARPHARLQDDSDHTEVPWPEDVVSIKAGALIADEGKRLIMESPSEELGHHGMDPCGDIVMRCMPCGLYGAEVRLPDGFLRMTSVKMSGWMHGIGALIPADSPEWHRQWSSEPGIAGCPAGPRAYTDRDGEGILLRLLGSENDEDHLVWLSGWSVPEIGDDDGFDFPVGLYAELVGRIAARLT